MSDQEAKAKELETRILSAEVEEEVSQLVDAYHQLKGTEVETMGGLDAKLSGTYNGNDDKITFFFSAKGTGGRSGLSEIFDPFLEIPLTRTFCAGSSDQLSGVTFYTVVDPRAISNTVTLELTIGNVTFTKKILKI